MKSKIDVYSLDKYSQSGVAVYARDGMAGGPVMGRGGNPKLEKLNALKKRWHSEQEPVRAVEGVLLVHVHQHPHVLLLKQTTQRYNIDAHGTRVLSTQPASGADVSFSLPGGWCNAGESEERGLMRHLRKLLLNEDRDTDRDDGGGGSGNPETILFPQAPADERPFWAGEVVGRWFRPHLNSLMYPYVPPHIPRQSIKEIQTIYLVNCRSVIDFNLYNPQSDMELVAVPLFDLYDNSNKYGATLASLPAALSRLEINYR